MSRTPAPCGTNAAYARHIVRREPVDQACRDAHNAYGRDRNRTGRARRKRARQAAVEALQHRHAEEYAALYAAALREEYDLAGGAR